VRTTFVRPLTRRFGAFSSHEGVPAEAALRLGVKRSSVYRLCAKGALPHVRVGSLLRIDVDAYLAAPRSWKSKR